jgi:glutathione S-transferase
MITQLKKLSPSGLVPVLISKSLNKDLRINDSLSICEFLAESNPELHLWPEDPQLRALARSAVAEFHGGFSELRNTYHTNFVAKYTGVIPITEKGRQEIERVLTLLGDARSNTIRRLKELGKPDAGYLFGDFSIADAFFWPVLWVCN